MYCCYDNPHTQCREIWENGRLTSFITHEDLIRLSKFTHTAAPWVDGKIHKGDIMAMKIKDETISQRKVYAVLNEKDLKDIISKYIAEKTNFNIDDNTKIQLLVNLKDRAGTAGYEPYAEVTLIQDLSCLKDS